MVVVANQPLFVCGANREIVLRSAVRARTLAISLIRIIPWELVVVFVSCVSGRLRISSILYIRSSIVMACSQSDVFTLSRGRLIFFDLRAVLMLSRDNPNELSAIGSTCI